MTVRKNKGKELLILVNLFFSAVLYISFDIPFHRYYNNYTYYNNPELENVGSVMFCVAGTNGQLSDFEITFSVHTRSVTAIEFEGI